MSLIQKVSSGIVAAKLNELHQMAELEGVARLKVEESMGKRLCVVSQKPLTRF